MRTSAKGVAAPPLSMNRYAPVAVVVVVLLVVGGAVTVGLLRPKTPPSVPGRQPAGANSAAAAAPGAMPEGHPPISIPDDVKQTLRDMAKSAQGDPENTALWTRLAEAQYRAGQIDPAYLAEAEQSFQHVLDRDPKNADILRSLGNIAFDREEPEKAIGHYQKYLELKPDDDNVRTDMNTMRLAAGQVDEAIAGYRAVLAKNPSFFQAHFNLGLAYMRTGKTDEALAELQKSRDLAADDRVRTQVDQVIARAKGGAAPVAEGARAPAAPSGSLRAGIEDYFRGNQIMASKVDRFEWEDDHSVKVWLHDFPMAAMPDFVRGQMVDRIRTRIKEQKTAHQVTAAVQVQLVDSATKEAMETVKE
ncbi:MAG TPA: tetratricopeptide repeat protein [Candidatus Binatia bacterium]|nr:tetratricopeptide repeat protein [Candidatus Binatia bacterium]